MPGSLCCAWQHNAVLLTILTFVVFSVLIVQLSLHHIILNAPRTANGLLKSLVSEGKASEAKSLLHSLEEFFEPL